MSAQLAPTITVYSPPSVFQAFACTSNQRKALSSRGMLTRRLSPGARRTLAKPLSSLAGRRMALPGLPTYTWATSAPSTLPVLVRVKLTSSSLTARSL